MFPYSYNYPYGRPYVTAWTYTVIVPAAAKPLTLDEVKTHLKIDLLDLSQDTYLDLLIDAVTTYAERYTRRDLINKTYRTFRNGFSDWPIELRRSKFQSLASFQYLVNGVLTPVPVTDYYSIFETDFSSIYLNNVSSWPTNIDARAQAIAIDFVAGYGPTSASVPQDFRMALLNHIARMYENRGDCGDCGGGKNLPIETQIIYDLYRIEDILV